MAGSLAVQALIYGVITTKPVIRSDGVGYYLYLPAALVHRDLTLQSVVRQEIPGRDSGRLRQQGRRSPSDQVPVGRSPLAVALLFARVGRGRPDPASPPHLAGPIKRALRRRVRSISRWGDVSRGYCCGESFDRRLAWPALLFTVFGTNLFHYATYDAGFSHVYSFCLAAGLLLISKRLPNSSRRSDVARLGWLCWRIDRGNAPDQYPSVPFPALLLVHRHGLAGGRTTARLWSRRIWLLAALGCRK